MEKFYTPMRTPSIRTRRKAISPVAQESRELISSSSPYNVVELDMDEKKLKERILEQDTTIRELQKTIKRMEEDMSSKVNESILIETSNRINAHESRIYQTDISLYEHDLRETKEHMKKLRFDLSTEVSKRVAAEDDLRRRLIEIAELEHKLKDANDAKNALQEKLVSKDHSITQLGSELTSAKFEISTLQTRLDKSRQDVEQTRMQNKDLSLEIATLKVALAKSKEEVRRNLEDVKDQKEDMTKREIELRRSLETNFVSHNISTSNNLVNAFQSLSSQLMAMQKTQFTSEQLADIQRQLGELSATNKFLQEKVMDYQEKENKLSQQLAETRDSAESAKVELETLHKKLTEVEGSSSLTYQYLLEEASKVKQQKADLRCELLELRRDYNRQKEKLDKLEAKTVDEAEMGRLRSDFESCRNREERLLKEVERLKKALDEATKERGRLEMDLKSTRDEAGEANIERKINQELREELKKAETKLIELSSTMEVVDSQCEQFRELKKRAEAGRQKALSECADMTVKLREVERQLESQRSLEVEVKQQKAERDRLEMKIRYLNDELRETHNDYRAELAQLAKQISETKCRDATDNEHYTIKIDELKNKLAQAESLHRSLDRQVEEVKQENAKLREQLIAGERREQETAEENKKLRGGLTDALRKIDQYKKEAESAKETCQEMTKQLEQNEESITKLEDELISLEERLEEKEKLEAYLQSQIKAKDMPKLSRRSTLLRTPTESSIEIIDPVVVEELENERTSLLKELEEKKKELNSRKMMPPPVPKGHRLQPSAPYSNTVSRKPLAKVQSKSIADIRCTSLQQNRIGAIGKSTSQSATMRHEIPHRWTELRHFGLFTIKCAVCFVGVPTFGKKKRCTHCGIIVHSQCATRVANTCGLPDQCANYYLDSYSAPVGKMNGWVRLFSDDSNTREWQSAWGEMDERNLAFYDHQAVQSDLKKPFLSVDLEKELRIVRVGSEVPVKTDSGQVSHNIVHIKTESRNIYILAPSTQTAKRWAEALQNASSRRMMLTRRPSSFSEQSCVLVLPAPNNLTIHTICVIDDYLLIGAQSGLFFTHMSSPRVPVRISGFNSVAAMEWLSDLSILAMITDHRRSLALVPLSSLKAELHSVQPSLRADVLSGYDNLHALAYYHHEDNRYLCAASSTKIHVLKYNAARDVFTGHQVIETSEPAMCLTTDSRGLYYGSDSFYFVHLGKGNLEPLRLADSSISDYPIALLILRDDEVLLAYQNYGIFVNSRGERTRTQTVEWEQMPMEFVYTAPYLYVIHYDSIEIMQVADFKGPDTDTVLDEREVYECQNAHVVCCRPNGDVFISISNTDSVEVHRFNATNSKRSSLKRKGLSAITYDKRSKVAL